MGNRIITLFEAFSDESMVKMLLPKKKKSSYEILVNKISSDKKIPVNKINDVLYKIAWHETGKTLDPLQKQQGGGPGRGLYQYEPASLKTAINRIYNFFKKTGGTTPKWVDTIKSHYDASRLSPQQQSFIALVDLVERSNFNLTRATSGDKELVDEWGKGWQTKNDPQKKKKFLAELPLFYQAKSANKVKYLER